MGVMSYIALHTDHAMWLAVHVCTPVGGSTSWQTCQAAALTQQPRRPAAGVTCATKDAGGCQAGMQQSSQGQAYSGKAHAPSKNISNPGGLIAGPGNVSWDFDLSVPMATLNVSRGLCLH